MKRLTVQVMAAVLTFGIGLAASMIAKLPLTRTPAEVMSAEEKNSYVAALMFALNQEAPLRLTQTHAENNGRKIRVENVSGKSVVAYTIGCSSPRLEGWLFSNTILDGEREHALEPGGSATKDIRVSPGEQVGAWVDFVEFADGTTWGPDRAEAVDSFKEDRKRAQNR